MSLTVFSYAEGISLNERQYLLDDEDNLLSFSSPDKAIAYLNARGVDANSEEELEEEFGIHFDRSSAFTLIPVQDSL